MNKRGQVTLFIIIAILIVAVGIAGYFIYQNYQKVKQERMAEEIAPIKAYVEDCLRKTTIDALEFVGLQGGYYVIKGPFIIYQTSALPLYLENGRKNVPTKEIVEQEISDYIINEIKNCVNNFTAYEERGFEVSEGNLAIYTALESSKVTVKMEYFLTITTPTVRTTIKDFDFQIKTNIYDLYNVAGEFVEGEIGAKGPDIDRLLDLISEKRVYVELIPWEDNIAVFIIKDNSTETLNLFKKPLHFRFANKY